MKLGHHGGCLIVGSHLAKLHHVWPKLDKLYCVRYSTQIHLNAIFKYFLIKNVLIMLNKICLFIACTALNCPELQCYVWPCTLHSSEQKVLLWKSWPTFQHICCLVSNFCLYWHNSSSRRSQVLKYSPFTDFLWQNFQQSKPHACYS